MKCYIEPDRTVTMKEDLVECCKGLNIPLTPVRFLERAATLYGDKVSIIYNDHVRFSWRQTYERCVKLASALVNLGISQGDIVSCSFLFQLINLFNIFHNQI